MEIHVVQESLTTVVSIYGVLAGILLIFSLGLVMGITILAFFVSDETASWLVRRQNISGALFALLAFIVICVAIVLGAMYVPGLLDSIGDLLQSESRFTTGAFLIGGLILVFLLWQKIRNR